MPATPRAKLAALGLWVLAPRGVTVVWRMTALSTCLVLLFCTPAATLLPSPRPLAPGNLLASLPVRALPALAARAAVASGSMAVLQPHAAAAVEVASGAELPNDSFVVLFALLILVGTGLLNASLGDIVADEVSNRHCRSLALGWFVHPTDARGPLACHFAGAAAVLRQPNQQESAATLDVHQGQEGLINEKHSEKRGDLIRSSHSAHRALEQTAAALHASSIRSDTDSVAGCSPRSPAAVVRSAVVDA